MQQSNPIVLYIQSVCAQIRWKKAHEYIADELEAHIIDQKQALIDSGYDEPTALEKAVSEMGDPVSVGQALDRTHRPKTEWRIIALTFMAMLLGLGCRLYITNESGLFSKILPSIVSLGIGLGCMSIVYFVDFTMIGKFPRIIYIGLLIGVLGIQTLSPTIAGRLTHAQFILLLFPTAFGGLLYHYKNKGYKGIILCGLYFVVPIYLALQTPSFSSLILYVTSCLFLMTFTIAQGFFNVNKVKALLLIYVPFVTFGILGIARFLNQPEGMTRLKMLLAPGLYLSGLGQRMLIQREIMAHAKLIGKCDILSDTSTLLSSADTSYLITFLIYHVGWISFIVIILVLGALLAIFIRLSLRQKSVLGRILSMSVFMTLLLQVILYVSSNLGFGVFFPETLPLISYGGVSTIINMTLIGVVLSVFRTGDVVRDRRSDAGVRI